MAAAKAEDPFADTCGAGVDTAEQTEDNTNLHFYTWSSYDVLYMVMFYYLYFIFTVKILFLLLY